MSQTRRSELARALKASLIGRRTNTEAAVDQRADDCEAPRLGEQAARLRALEGETLPPQRGLRRPHPIPGVRRLALCLLRLRLRDLFSRPSNRSLSSSHSSSRAASMKRLDCSSWGFGVIGVFPDFCGWGFLSGIRGLARAGFCGRRSGLLWLRRSSGVLLLRQLKKNRAEVSAVEAACLVAWKWPAGGIVALAVSPVKAQTRSSLERRFIKNSFAQNNAYSQAVIHRLSI